MPLLFISEDITTAATDAIVNAANTKLRNYATRSGGGVCGAIFRAAGHSQMQEACNQIGGCETGQAVITEGFALPAKFVIHAVGPQYRENDPSQAALLYRSYQSALYLAQDQKLKTITFPLISSGIYGYPKFEALEIAVRSILDYLEKTGDTMDVFLCLLDRELLEKAECLRKNHR